ncbi:hypothetical protein JHFBIEKO_4323 [Methylobacterium mesophilicum]|uniref:hypothetical protein n=1 Tax=Methylobacterium mesophilicum TaxID=39956 RepID=UPI001EE36867|nr:hypothetical protein [Methylobacterium mesophilicum]GJE23859.1 hypothetical protein JHFBIEKO_4323 [Methylobacterium mesophilicum]
MDFMRSISIASMAIALSAIASRAFADDFTSVAGIWALDKSACKLTTPDYDDRLRIFPGGKNGGAEDQCNASGIKIQGGSLLFTNVCKTEDQRTTSKVRIQVVSPAEFKWIEGRAPSVSYIKCGDIGNPDRPVTNTSNKPIKYAAGSFSLSSHGYSATITSLEGADTSRATMLGAVTREDAAEECERNSPGGSGLKPRAMQSCVDRTLTQTAGKVFRSSADCKSQNISPNFGGRYLIIGRDEVGNLRIYDAKGHEIGYSSASGSPSIEDQFKHLCPRTSTNIKGKS